MQNFLVACFAQVLWHAVRNDDLNYASIGHSVQLCLHLFSGNSVGGWVKVMQMPGVVGSQKPKFGDLTEVITLAVFAQPVFLYCGRI